MKLPFRLSVGVVTLGGFAIASLLAYAALFALGYRPISEQVSSQKQALCVFQAFLVESHLSEAGLPEPLLRKAQRGLAFFQSPSWLYSEEGGLLAQSLEEAPPYPWARLPRPEKAATLKPFRDAGGPMVGLVKLRTSPPRYLLCNIDFGSAPWAKRAAARVTLLVGVVLGSLVTPLLLWLFFRARARQAGQLVEALKGGNLRARLSLREHGDIGGMFGRFNSMAEEIEHLVGRLRDSEGARVQFLQELAHDLRTPLMSVKLTLENLADGDIAAADAKPAIEGALRELDYLGRLIDDLFFLSQMNEPGYRPAIEPVDVIDILRKEARRMPEDVVMLDFGSLGQSFIVGDIHLLTRLFRNTLENARRHARRRIEVSVRETEDRLLVTVQDDGPGFSGEALASFGQRRPIQLPRKPHEGRVSLGLGSVIMVSIARLQGGALRVANREASLGGGARMEIELVKRIAPGHSLTPPKAAA